jgi:hypothetical protein
MSPGLYLLFAIHPVFARDYNVGTYDSNDDFSTLEDAVAAALLTPADDVLYIDSGYQMDELVLEIDGGRGLSGKITFAPQPPETSLYLSAVVADNGAELEFQQVTFTSSALPDVPLDLLRLDFSDLEPYCAVCLNDSTALLQDSSFADPYAMAVLAVNSALTLKQVTVQGHVPPAILAWSSSVDPGVHSLQVMGGEFLYNEGTAIRARGDGQEVRIDGATFGYNYAAEGSSDLEVFYRKVILNNVTFSHSYAASYSFTRFVGAAPVSGRFSSVEATGLDFDHTLGSDANGMYMYVDGQTVDVDGVSFVPDIGSWGRVFKVYANSPDSGGKFYLRNLNYTFDVDSFPTLFTAHNLAEAAFTDSLMDLNGMDADGTLVDLSGTFASLERLTVCNSVAGQYQYPLIGVTSSEVMLSRSVFQKLALPTSLMQDLDGNSFIYVSNNDFNRISAPAGLVGIDSPTSSLYFFNNSVSDNTIGLLLPTTLAGGGLTHNHWNGNGTDILGAGDRWESTYDQYGDPLFTDYDPNICGSMPIPHWGSPLINTGLRDDADGDPDGITDIGRWFNQGEGKPGDSGGDSGDSGPIDDSEGDSQTDVDGDGILAADDCNDNDPSLGGPEIFNDGRDQDCDGLDTTSSLVGAVCACSGSAAAPTGAFWLLGLAMLRRRKA